MWVTHTHLHIVDLKGHVPIPHELNIQTGKDDTFTRVAPV